MSADKVELEVFTLLKEVDAAALEGLCQGLSIVIPTAKQGNTSLIIKLIMRFLHSEDVEKLEDEGFSIFLKLHTDLQEILGKKGENNTDVNKDHVNKDVKVEPVTPNNQYDSLTDIKPQFQLHRFREFKINGTVGGETDQKDTLSYISLSFQMEQGRKRGCSSGEIEAAVFKAMRPGRK